jgi:hypothetical protein
MPIGIARTKSFHSGATPSSTLPTSVPGEKTRKSPASTSRSWVAKSMTASRMLTPVDSFAPNTLMAASTAMTRQPATMSPGDERSGSQNSPPT